MPEIKLQYVASFSSEDKHYAAENLLKSDGYKKWKSASKGEKQVSVTLQFEKASIINQIDIGNEGSAFVEVLVGRSSFKDDQYQVMLVASSFMTPIESRNGQNLNRVRMFSSDSLSQAVIKEKWDRVKIVCTQPFNKNGQYGLSFVKFHSPPDVTNDSKPAVTKQLTLGRFTVKEEDNSDPIATGSLFATRRKESTQPASVTGAAAVRAASRQAEEVAARDERKLVSAARRDDREPVSASSREEKQPMSSVSREDRKPLTPAPIKRKYSEDPAEPKVKVVSRDTGQSGATAADSGGRPRLQKKATSISSMSSSSSTKPKDTEPPMKKRKSEPSKAPKQKVFSELMENVVFVLSGFQNPLRGSIRDKAMEMGARYKTDWGKTCTHLICAFENTPKYNQVKGKGKIVKKDWITECYKQEKLLPWRSYRLGRAPSPPESSSSESGEEDLIPARKSPLKTNKNSQDTTENKRRSASPFSTAQGRPLKQNESEEDYGGSTDVGDSGSDTEDEIQRVLENQNKANKKTDVAKNNEDDDIYNASTDEEEPDSKDHDREELPELPDFFADRHFFLYGSFPSTERRNVIRYIAAYEGNLHDYMSDEINYVITMSDWDKNFDDALSDNPDLTFVKPSWIYACHAQQKMLPHQKYIVVPK